MAKSKVLLIGWDAADWKVIHPLMDAGHMPALKSLVNSGVMGKMATLDPPLSPMLWTSIATGKRPYKHGIHGFTEPTPDGKGLRPIYNTNRKCKAIWNILTQEQKKCHVVGWWPSHPAEPINGVMISNFYQRAEKDPNKQWQLLDGVVHPKEKADFFAKLRVHPYEMTSAHIAPFVPNFEQVDQINDKSLEIIAKNLADSSTIHCAGSYLMEHEDWDFLAVYFDAIDHFCHGFMRYHPPRRDFVSLRQYELYKDVVASSYRFHDMILGRYLEMADEETTIVLISDHGFHPDHNRPEFIPKEPTGPAIEHSPYGIVVMKGPGIKRDELIYGANLLDVTPTLLHIFGLPVGNDMDGKVLLHAFEHDRPVAFIESWEQVPGESGRHPEGIEQSAEEMRDELQQLIDLGYVADPGPDIQVAIQNTLHENNFNLARAYLNGQQWTEGIALLEQLHESQPDVFRYAMYLINAYQIVGRYKQARSVVNTVRGFLDRESTQLDMVEGTLLLAEQRPIKALELFKKVEAEAGLQSQLRLRLASAYIQMNKFEEVIKILQTAMEEEPEEAGGWYMLGVSCSKIGNYELATDYLLQAIGLQYYNPVFHYALGETLMAMQKYEEAEKAFEVCLKIAPSMNMARKKLIALYELFLDSPEKIIELQQNFDQAIKGEIVVVSGLPRSGTSMMMQMLKAGGVELFTDEQRVADENNEKGYLEHEEVKNLARNKTWLPRANGKGVKVIAQLLQHLPLNYRYKIVFMERDLLEVVASQQKMLYRMKKTNDSEVLPLSILEQYKITLMQIKKWLKEQLNIEVLYVDYNKVLENPQEESMKINEFLGNTLSVYNMTLTVDKQMKREGVPRVIDRK